MNMRMWDYNWGGQFLGSFLKVSEMFLIKIEVNKTQKIILWCSVCIREEEENRERKSKDKKEIKREGERE